MKKNTIIILSALLIAGAACTKNEVSNQQDVCEIGVNIAPDTKVAIADKSGGVYPLTWETGDRLLVNYTTVTNPLDASYNGKKTATFSLPGKLYYPFTIIYPAEVAGGDGYILIPAEQTFAQGRLAGGCGIMTALIQSSGMQADMHHLCGYVRVPVKGSATLASVSLSANAGEILAGRFSVDAVSATMTYIESPAGSIESSSRLTLSTSATLSANETVYYFAVPAGVYEKGFKCTIKDANGQEMSRTLYSASGKTITPGVVLEMPAVDYVPGAPTAEEFSISESELNFTATNFTKSSVRIVAGDEDVNVTAQSAEWLACDVPTVIPAGRSLHLQAYPQTANVSDKRSCTITFRGAKSGKEKTLTIKQANLYKGGYGFPALWEISSSMTYVTNGVINEAGKLWVNEGYATAQKGAGANIAIISGGSTEGRKLKYTIDATSSSKTLSITGMQKGDYFLFSVPVTDVPAGTDFDFMCTINASSTAAPKYFIFEYWDKDRWKCDENRLYTAPDGSKYSFYIKYFSSANHRTFIQSFKLDNAVKDDFIKMRVRVSTNINGADKTIAANHTGNVFFATTTYEACYLTCYKDAVPVKDTTRMMQLGNSFTYYFGSAFKLKDMCRRAGHQTDVHINLKGGQEFEHHMYNLEFSQGVVAEGGYDKALIQDGSYFHAEYGAGSKSAIVGVTPKYTPEEILRLTQLQTQEIKKYSPNAQIFLESVWSYSRKAAGDNYLGFGSFDNFDYYQWKGSTEIAAAAPLVNWLTPIGKAFANARKNYGFGSSYNYLNYTDNYHPSREGAYLKSCVNFLTLFGDDFPAVPTDCELAPADAAKLRQAARDIVYGHREDFHFNK